MMPYRFSFFILDGHVKGSSASDQKTALQQINGLIFDFNPSGTVYHFEFTDQTK